MEIERKYLVTTPPEDYRTWEAVHMEQAYLCTAPVVRIRKENDEYFLTYKSKGLLAREEYNLPLTKEAYAHLLEKADGIIITKTRYKKPIEGTDLVIELDVFSGEYEGLMLAEVEFSSIEDAEHFAPPDWFGEDVTFSGEYQNSRLSQKKKLSDFRIRKTGTPSRECRFLYVQIFKITSLQCTCGYRGQLPR